ncbi:MAG: kinesin-like nuclear fusion protein [Vezdaea aestivalis]|nr:MAG: kinesin-like nuclear fusion protein [Vezdaea aestivalis]
MDDYDENAMMSPIPPPSKIPSPHRPLSEMSAANSNIRAPDTIKMLPPQANGVKHKISSLPGPALKRRTLTERGGEPSRPPLPNPLAFSSSVQGTSLSHARNPSLPSVSSRGPSSNGNNYGRPASVQSQRRPAPARGISKSVAPPRTRGRPASALSGNLPNGNRNNFGNSKGTSDFSLTIPKVRKQRSKRRSSEGPQFDDAPSRNIRPTSEPGVLTLKSIQDISLCSTMRDSILEDFPQSPTAKTPMNGSFRSSIPVRTPKAASLEYVVPATPSGKPKQKAISPVKSYLTRDSILEWNTSDRIDNMETMFNQFKSQVEGTSIGQKELQETIGVFKTRVHELESMRIRLQTENTSITKRLVDAEENLRSVNAASNMEQENFERELRSYLNQMEDVERQHRREIEDQERKSRDELDRADRQFREDMNKLNREAQESIERLSREHQNKLRELEQQTGSQVDEERSKRLREIQELNTELSIERQKAGADLGSKSREVLEVKDELGRAHATIETKDLLIRNLRAEFDEISNKLIGVESTCRAQKARIDFLESDSSAQAQSFADAEQRMQDAFKRADEYKEKLWKEETLRRMLHNQVQELKGNIRVFCRVRPTLTDEADDSAKIEFPDEALAAKEINVQGAEEKSSLGTVTTKQNAFAFDKVFSPVSQNNEIFDEISQLVQSALDGYNVCIFCYGQTGAGKTHTMLSSDGMIPRAVNQIYESTLALEEKGWKYTLEGNFVEVYNENLNDLLGKATEFDNKKHEIHNDQQKRTTTITGITTEALDSPGKVEIILKKANANRSVAATKANERSSRSHSVFILKLRGENRATGESSEGTLNLVDLAGSERLSQSQATGDRLKETQSINKSLSALGDVISALGQSKASAHIPYRNSKLTELLQFSLGGNSKTLMFVMVSPLKAHLSETLTSLKFATRVHNTHIGTAKKQSKVKD